LYLKEVQLYKSLYKYTYNNYRKYVCNRRNDVIFSRKVRKVEDVRGKGEERVWERVERPRREERSERKMVLGFVVRAGQTLAFTYKPASGFGGPTCM
jgi:lysine/ornithine N-monooxygenase